MAVLNVLVLNAGSSSLKASLFRLDSAGEEGDPPGDKLWESDEASSPSIDEVLGRLDRSNAIDVVGHRIVFGGLALQLPTRVTNEIRDELARDSEYAPAHNSAAIAGIDAATRAFGESIPQIAVFDTAFHQSMAPDAYTYAGPYDWVERGIRRFGFHGLSHRYTSSRAMRMLKHSGRATRIVTCHLGSGCSLAAVRGGRSVDTTMGFTPMDGIPMVRRSGAVDPGIIIHLLRHGVHTVDSLDRMLNHDSGLAGISGTSGDMREVVEAMNARNDRACLAFDVFVHQVRKGIAAMAASMDGIDALVFTGGIGEHSPIVRAAIVDRLGFLGAGLDMALNETGGGERVISPAECRVVTLVIQAEENWVIARDSFRAIRS